MTPGAAGRTLRGSSLDRVLPYLMLGPTLFLVLERQTALTTARGQELRAQTDLNKAIAELQRATGNALQANNVVVSAR